MNIYINEENYKHEVFELVRQIIGNEEIVFIDENKSRNHISIIINKNITIRYIEEGTIKYESVVENFEEIIKKSLTDKMLVKSEILKLFKCEFNKDSSWGVLTGIRPVKIAKNYLGNNSEVETLEYLESKLFLNKEKAKLITDIAINQDKYISKLKDKSFSIYINIPFCPTRCDYCSFATLRLDKHGEMVDEYIEVLKKELLETLRKIDINKLNTMYIGGGTPTSLNEKQLENLLNFINSNIPNTINIEFTVEAGREDTLTLEKLKILKNNNVNRISLNPQSFKEETLDLIGRKQNNTELIKRYYEAKKLGFESINMDLILGLPGENVNDLKETLNIIEEFQPENLTIHTLSVKKGAKINEQEIKLIEEQKIVEEMMEISKKFARDNKYIPYYIYRQKQILGNMENIGFSKNGKECVYNITMMEEEENIIGIGMGASSKFINVDGNIINHRNYKNMRDYINNIEKLIEDKKYIIGDIYDKRS